MCQCYYLTTDTRAVLFQEKSFETILHPLDSEYIGKLLYLPTKNSKPFVKPLKSPKLKTSLSASAVCRDRWTEIRT